ncbi:hypothetical protein TNCV_1855551 [Trichonephila clavipes]|nr:hypothetical protein TNCV_1855551 [Trichonephila clavipes]
MPLKLMKLSSPPPNYRDVRKIKEPTYQLPFTLRREQRVRKLLGREELGDRKSSQFLRHLCSLAGGHRDKTYTPSFLIVVTSTSTRPSHSTRTINPRIRSNGRYGR